MLDQKTLIYSYDWDLLIILDACRYDIFYSLFKNRYSIARVESRGSCTPEWFVKTFTRPLRDTIYVSGSPAITSRRVKIGEYVVDTRGLFTRVIDAWVSCWRRVGYAHTCDPQIVNNLAYTTHNLYPRHRLIVHYTQPHAPYIHSRKLSRYFNNLRFSADKGLWNALQNKEIDPGECRKFYVDNLTYVMKYVGNLINKIKPRKYVITSDHGESWGEDNIYNHPCGHRNPVLVHVPWATEKEL